MRIMLVSDSEYVKKEREMGSKAYYKQVQFEYGNIYLCLVEDVYDFEGNITTEYTLYIPEIYTKQTSIKHIMDN